MARIGGKIMEYITLNNGVKMPMAGFGVFQIKDKEECVRVVLEAIETGYRLIDTAQSYGNEEAVGEAILKTNVPREELFVDVYKRQVESRLFVIYYTVIKIVRLLENL